MPSYLYNETSYTLENSLYIELGSDSVIPHPWSCMLPVDQHWILTYIRATYISIGIIHASYANLE